MGGGAREMSIANYDAQAGIHFGFIYQNHIDIQEVYDRIISSGVDLGWESVKAEAQAKVKDMAEEINEAIREFNGQIDDIIKSHLDGWDVIDVRSNLDIDGPELIEGDAWDSLEQQFSDETQEMESGPWRYEEDGYLIDTTSDNGLFIIKSPYFTYCRECSPCAPNAGYLMDQPGSMKTYCLGADWFDEYSPLPYTVYSVETGEVVTEGPKEED
jgi:hypothetical protein